MLHNDSDFLSDVLALENEVRKNEGADEADILSYELLQKIILLCANSKKYDDLTFQIDIFARVSKTVNSFFRTVQGLF